MSPRISNLNIKKEQFDLINKEIKNEKDQLLKTKKIY